MASLFGGSGSTTGGRFAPGAAASDDAEENPNSLFKSSYAAKAATNKKDLAEALHRLHAAGDVENFNKIAASSGSVFSPEDIKRYGLDKYGQGEGVGGKSWGSRFMENTGKAFSLGNSATGGLLGKGLEVLDRPSKRSLAILGNVRRGEFGQAFAQAATAPVDLLPTSITGDMGAEAQLRQSVPDKDGDGQINFREVLGLDPDAGGRVAGALDTAAIIGTDPTTYMTLGASGLGKAGLKTIGKEFGDDMVRKIAQNGLKGAVKKGLISELEEEGIKAALRKSADELVISAAKKRSVRKLVEREGEERAASILADESYKAVAKQGRSGLRVGLGANKRTIIPSNPTGKSLLPGLQAKFDWQYGAKAAEAAGDVLSGPQTSQPVRKTLLGAIKETAPGARVRESFITRAATRAKFGESVGEKVYGAVEQAASVSGRSVNDMMIQVAPLSEVMTKELKDGAGAALEAAVPAIAGRKGYEAFNDVVLGVLEGSLDSAAVKAALAADGMSGAVKAVEAFEDVVRQQADAIARTRGAVPPAEPGLFDDAANKTPQLARVLTPEAEALVKAGKTAEFEELFGMSAKDIKAGTDMTDALGTVGPEVARVVDGVAGAAPTQTLGQDMATLPGRTYADMPIREVNDDLVKRLGLEEGTKIFTDDAMTAVALRGKTAFQAAAQVDIFESLAKETINGQPLVTIIRPSDGALKTAAAREAAKKNGWKQLNEGQGKKLAIGEVWGPPEIMDDLSKMHDMIVNDASLKSFSNFLNKWNGMWASYATVPLIFGTGFHSRNAIGNVILSFYGGVTNPARFVKALDLQWDVARTRALMKKEGLNFEDALTQQVKSERSRQLIRDMRDHGIISNGFFADISGDEVDNVLRHNKVSDWLKPSKIGARLQDNQMIRTGRKAGDVVENNARVALYMDAYEKMGSVQQAANHVKKYLFDYQDLTPFERRYMKSANRFYTFTRKNLAVQTYTLAHDPWRIKTATDIEALLYDQGDTDDAALPEYARKGGFSISRMLGQGEGGGVAMNIDTPLDSAIKTLDPITQGVSMIPGLQEVVPPEYRSNKQELTKSIVGLRAGGPVEFINFLMEEATGKDLYSGKDISEESSGDTFQRLANAFVPLYSKGETFSSSAANPLKALPDSIPGGGGKFGEDPNHPGMTARLALMQALVGFQILPITDKQTNQVAYAGAQEAMDALAELKAQGIDVPTYTDLVKLGIAPDLREKKAKTTRLTPAQADKARVSKLQEARKATGAPAMSLTPPKDETKKTKSLF